MYLSKIEGKKERKEESMQYQVRQKERTINEKEK